MTDSPAAPLLRVPPFPGARRHALGRRAATARPATEAQVDAALAALARAEVGGTYWGQRPLLPAIPYVLVRMCDAAAEDEVVRAAAGAPAIVRWTARGSARGDERVRSVTGEIDPWHLVRGATRVVADADDELLLIAALAGVAVEPVGHGPFAALGHAPAALRDLVRAHLSAWSYASPFSGQPIAFAEAVELCAFWKALIDANRAIVAVHGFAGWKRTTAAPLLWSGAGDPPFGARPAQVGAGDDLVVWTSRVDAATRRALGRAGGQVVEAEDGFIRSIGLGADCVPPLSLVLDRAGIYFDPRQPSDLENILQNGDFPAALVDRARDLRALIVARGISKYGAGQPPVAAPRTDRPCLLVPGQVEDDRSVLCGGGAVTTNLELLRRARQQAPGAHIVYKPHPDVEAGHRKGALPEAIARQYADEIVADQPISALIDRADAVHVNTSLAGFEALLRGKPVTTHGVPFYAGWGLTSDLGAVPPRRTARRMIDELVAATLLLYPRYLDPATGLPCTAETLVHRLAEGGAAAPAGPLVRLRRLQGALRRRIAALRGFA